MSNIVKVIPYIEEDGVIVRDLGWIRHPETKLCLNSFCITNNYLFNISENFQQVEMSCAALGVFIKSWFNKYHFSPRNFKVHRSFQNYLYFCISVYFPWRYTSLINTAMV